MNKPVVVSQNTVAQELSSSKNRDLVALVEKTKNATEKGTDSIRTLRHYSEANALSRMWNDKKIKLSTVTAIESVHELTQVSLVLTKINHDMAFELGGAVDRLEASDDAIKKVQQELRLQQEAIAETLKKDRERGQLIDLLMESDDELLQDLNAMRRDLKALGADNLADQLDSFTRQLIQNTRAIEGVEKENKKLKHMLVKIGRAHV